MTPDDEILNVVKEKIAWGSKLNEEEQALCDTSKECQALVQEMITLNAKLSDHLIKEVPKNFADSVMNRIYAEEVYQTKGDDLILNLTSRLAQFRWVEVSLLSGGLLFAIANIFRTFFAVLIPFGI